MPLPPLPLLPFPLPFPFPLPLPLPFPLRLLLPLPLLPFWFISEATRITKVEMSVTVGWKCRRSSG